jgi:chitinase
MANNTSIEKATNTSEQKLKGLILGTTKPVSKSDKKLQEEIKAIQAKGRIVEIPQEFM